MVNGGARGAPWRRPPPHRSRSSLRRRQAQRSDHPDGRRSPERGSCPVWGAAQRGRCFSRGDRHRLHQRRNRNPSAQGRRRRLGTGCLGQQGTPAPGCLQERRRYCRACEATAKPDDECCPKCEDTDLAYVLHPSKHRLRFHDLRHTCAAMLIAEGAHSKAIWATRTFRPPSTSTDTCCRPSTRRWALRSMPPTRAAPIRTTTFRGSGAAELAVPMAVARKEQATLRRH
jgi:hypothetical protein